MVMIGPSCRGGILESFTPGAPDQNLMLGINMGNFFNGLLFLTLAGLGTWLLYAVFIDAKSNVGFIDSDRVSYRKSNGTIIGKQATQYGYEIKFTYPESSNSFQDVLTVSRKEFDHTKVGDKMPIFYGIHFPVLWIPVHSGKIYYGGIAIALMVTVYYLVGGYYIYRAIIW